MGSIILSRDTCEPSLICAMSPDGLGACREPHRRCWGCGICETHCPVHDQAAIRVASVGESRSPVNRILLQGG